MTATAYCRGDGAGIWLRLVLALAFLLLVPDRLHALAMGPGLFMVQNVTPGQEIDLRKLGGLLFTVENDSGQEQDYNLTCRKPSQSGLTDWEKGYEEIPDPAWCRVEEAVFTIPARGKKQIGLIIAIPQAAENLNRKFMLAVVLKAGKDPAFGVGLAIAARVQIETTVNDQLADERGAAVAIAPGTLTLSGTPGAIVSGVVQVRNNTGARIETQIERLPQVYPDPAKHGRYVSNGFQPHPGEPWFVPRTPGFVLDAGGMQSLEFSGTIPATAALGQRYEELAFIRATAADGKAVLTLVRIQLVMATADAAKPAAAQPTHPTR